MINIEVFKDHPIAGAGDVLASAICIRKMKAYPMTLTSENQTRLSDTIEKGLFQSEVSSTPFTVVGMLANRGLLGFISVYLPICFLGIALVMKIFKLKLVYSQVGITLLISFFCVLLSVFTRGIKFYDFWCVAGLAFGFLLWPKPSLENTLNCN